MAAFILGLGVGIGALGLLISGVVRRMFLLDGDMALAAPRAPASSGSVLATWTAVHRARQVGEGVRAIDLSSLLSVPIHSVGLEDRELGTSRGLG